VAHQCRSEIVALCVLALTTVPVAAQSTASSDESRLKAAFVFRFPQFTEWPPAVFAGRDSFELCVLASSTFATNLRDLTAGESFQGHAVMIRDVSPERPIESCHVLFIGSAASADPATLLKRVRTRPVLTIGEASGFLDDGGIIHLRLVDRRVRFEINARAAQEAGLRLSSQLLRLAIGVRSAP
jgi:hypothetical protein